MSSPPSSSPPASLASPGPRSLSQRLRDYWLEAPNPNPLVDQSLARAYIADTRDTPLSAAVTAAVFWVLFLVLTGNRGTLVWAALVHAMQWNMHRHLHAIDPQAIDAANAASVRRRFELRMLFPGMVWALAPWLFFPHGDLAYILLMYFFVSGTTGVIIAALAQWWLAALCFGVPVFLSLALRLVLEPGSVPVIMGCLAVSQLLASLHYARKQNRLIVGSIENGFENGFENARLAQALSRQLDHVAQLAAQRARIFAAANHDLRQPMHALAIFVDALDTRAAPSAENLRFMRDSVDALRGSIDALLDIAQLDGGATPVRLEPLRLDPVFESLQGRFAALADAKGLALRIRPTEAVVRADARMLARVLGNLVDNAIKYTPEGTVLVLARRVRRASGGLPAWRIEVRDSGVGIDAQHREQVFEEFFQVDNPGRDRSRGLGLGLSLVAGMAQVMGSRIEVRSAPGRGSTFSLVLEEAPAPAEETHGQALDEPTTDARAIRILVLDDEQPVREAMRSLLSGWGHEVALAANPREALQHGGVFDLMLSDLRLGSGLSGLAAAQALQAVGKARNVVILTGETAHANRVEVERAGYALIYKPADARALQDAIAASRIG